VRTHNEHTQLCSFFRLVRIVIVRNAYSHDLVGNIFEGEKIALEGQQGPGY
jgi:hypothetical protein